MRTNKEIRIIAGIFSVVVFWIGYGVVQYLNKQSPEYLSSAEMKSKDRALIHLNPDEVEFITIERAGLQPLVESKLKVLEREDIARIINAISTSERMTVNHPSTIWECYLTLMHPGEARKIRITNTENQGLIIWAYSHFRCDGLGSILEEIAMQNHNNPRQ